MPTDADISACVERIASHGVGDPVLEGNTEELVLVLQSERFDEKPGHPFDDAAFARAGGAVAEAQERDFCSEAVGVVLVQQEPLVLHPEFLEDSCCHSLQDCHLFGRGRFLLLLQSFQPSR